MAIDRVVRVCVPAALAGLLAGCVVPPAVQPPLVVYPGANKTYADFHNDDAACRGVPLGQVAAQHEQSGQVAAGVRQGTPIAGRLGTPNDPPAEAVPAAGAPAGPQAPNPAYMQCMASRGNVIAPMPSAYAGVYPGYGYPAFAPGYGPGFVGDYPFLYADGLGFGFGFGGYGFGGGRFGWGDRGGFGGWRDGRFGRGDFGRGDFGRGGFGGHGGFGGRRG